MAKREFIEKEKLLTELKISAENHAQNSREEVLMHRDRNIVREQQTFTEQDIVKPYLDKIKSYTDHLRNCGMGKSKSLDFVDKFVDGLLSEEIQND